MPSSQSLDFCGGSLWLLKVYFIAVCPGIKVEWPIGPMLVTSDCIVAYDLRLSLSGSFMLLPRLYLLIFSLIEFLSLQRSIWLSVVVVGCDLEGNIALGFLSR